MFLFLLLFLYICKVGIDVVVRQLGFLERLCREELPCIDATVNLPRSDTLHDGSRRNPLVAVRLCEFALDLTTGLTPEGLPVRIGSPSWILNAS